MGSSGTAKGDDQIQPFSAEKLWFQKLARCDSGLVTKYRDLRDGLRSPPVAISVVAPAVILEVSSSRSSGAFFAFKRMCE